MTARLRLRRDEANPSNAVSMPSSSSHKNISSSHHAIFTPTSRTLSSNQRVKVDPVRSHSLSIWQRSESHNSLRPCRPRIYIGSDVDHLPELGLETVVAAGASTFRVIGITGLNIFIKESKLSTRIRTITVDETNVTDMCMLRAARQRRLQTGTTDRAGIFFEPLRTNSLLQG